MFFRSWSAVRKGIVVRGHEHTSLQVDHSVGNFSFKSLIHARPRHVRRIIRRSQHAPCRSVPVALNHLKVIDDFALIPDVIAGCDHVDVQLEEFFRQRRSNAEASRRIFAVRNDQIDGVIADDSGQPVFDDISSRASENVADKKNSHAINAEIRW